MTRAMAYLEPDLSLVRILSGSGDSTWRPDPAELEAEGGEGQLHHLTGPEPATIAEAAAWSAGAAQPQNRLDHVCVGVDQALCVWLAAPSADPGVVTAALRHRGEEWGDFGATFSTVQPLASEEPKAEEEDSSAGERSMLTRVRERFARQRGQNETKRMGVLCLQDGAVRNWLDELDRRGVRVGVISTLWHAAARAWAGEETGVTAVALIERGGRITWAWGQDGDLLAGGIAALPPEQELERGSGPNGDSTVALMDEAEAGRLVLDWLTWSAQLGASPDRIVVVGHGAERIASALGERWADAQVEVVDEGDPVGATLERLREAPLGEGRAEDPRRALVVLSRRPGRAHRRLYVWAAAAIGLLGVALAGVSFKMQQRADDFREQASELEASLRGAILEVDPNAANAPNPVRELRTTLATEMDRKPKIEEPPPPEPILEELERLAAAIAKMESLGGTIQTINLTDSLQGGNIILRFSGFEAEQIQRDVEALDGAIRWQGQISGQPPNVRLVLTGIWRQQS